MKPVRVIAITVTLMAASLVGGAFSVETVSAKSCPQRSSSSGDNRVGAHPVSGYFRTIQAAARGAGMAMTSGRQVVQVQVNSSFVAVRVVSAGGPCRVIGAIATNTDAAAKIEDRVPFKWSPPLPANVSGARYVTSSRGSITVQLRTTSHEKWHRYVATSESMRWTAGT